jgi:hypothetical protein
LMMVAPLTSDSPCTISIYICICRKNLSVILSKISYIAELLFNKREMCSLSHRQWKT